MNVADNSANMSGQSVLLKRPVAVAANIETGKSFSIDFGDKNLDIQSHPPKKAKKELMGISASKLLDKSTDNKTSTQAPKKRKTKKEKIEEQVAILDLKVTPLILVGIVHVLPFIVAL